MTSAEEALIRLKEGNKRFVSEDSQQSQKINQSRRHQLLEGQKPFAVILGCSDSRAPAEIVFDQGLGDLFVIRVAGNIVAPSQVGSIEFAVETYETPLVVVLGHSHCGAINATIEALENGTESTSHNLMSIVTRIKPSIETLFETDLKNDREELMKYAVRSNIRASVNQIRYSSPSIERLMLSDKLQVVGAEYSLETGNVNFFEGS